MILEFSGLLQRTSEHREQVASSQLNRAPGAAKGVRWGEWGSDSSLNTENQDRVIHLEGGGSRDCEALLPLKANLPPLQPLYSRDTESPQNPPPLGSASPRLALENSTTRVPKLESRRPRSPYSPSPGENSAGIRSLPNRSFERPSGQGSVAH